LMEATGARDLSFVDATDLALKLLGNAIGANMLMVGYAYQKGLLPLSVEAIEKALELNGVAVDFNKQAFLWGRRAAHDPGAAQRIADPAPETAVETGSGERRTIDRRISDLTRYQDAAYAKRYAALVEKVHATEAMKAAGKTGLVDAVAGAYFKLLAYKDEYEVARLYTDGNFQRQLDRQFDGPVKLSFHLAPPLIATPDPVSGVPRKREFGGWVMPVFRLLSKLKGLRGTVWDIFGYSAERIMERRMIGEYEAVIDEMLDALSPENHALAVDIAELPLTIRGFGHVKEANYRAAKTREQELLAAFRGSSGSVNADAAE